MKTYSKILSWNSAEEIRYPVLSKVKLSLHWVTHNEKLKNLNLNKSIFQSKFPDLLVEAVVKTSNQKQLHLPVSTAYKVSRLDQPLVTILMFFYVEN